MKLVLIVSVATAAAFAQTADEPRTTSSNGLYSGNRIDTSLPDASQRQPALIPGPQRNSGTNTTGRTDMSLVSLPAPAPASSGELAAATSVSLASLAHKPKAAAVKACLRAEKYSAARDFLHAAQQLEKAVAADPHFAAAHGNLGAEYAHLLRFQDASFELRRAIDLDPGTGIYYSNLALVLSHLNRMREAEEFASRGVELDAANAKSQLLLGWLLASDENSRITAVPHLVFAARALPEAHRILADVYHLTGRELQAQSEMRMYTHAAAELESK